MADGSSVAVLTGLWVGRVVLLIQAGLPVSSGLARASAAGWDRPVSGGLGWGYSVLSHVSLVPQRGGLGWLPRQSGVHGDKWMRASPLV